MALYHGLSVWLQTRGTTEWRAKKVRRGRERSRGANLKHNWLLYCCYCFELLTRCLWECVSRWTICIAFLSLFYLTSVTQLPISCTVTVQHHSNEVYKPSGFCIFNQVTHWFILKSTTLGAATDRNNQTSTFPQHSLESSSIHVALVSEGTCTKAPKLDSRIKPTTFCKVNKTAPWSKCMYCLYLCCGLNWKCRWTQAEHGYHDSRTKTTGIIFRIYKRVMGGKGELKCNRSDNEKTCM